jgi:hypothetical protein
MSFMAVTMKTAISWDAIQFSLVEFYQCFRGMYHLYLYGFTLLADCFSLSDSSTLKTEAVCSFQTINKLTPDYKLNCHIPEHNTPWPKNSAAMWSLHCRGITQHLIT